MKKISPSTRVTETDSLARNILDVYTKDSNLATMPYLSKIMANLQPVSQQLTEAIKRLKTKSILEDKDAARDQAFRSFYYLVLGATHHPDAAIRQAAKSIMTVLENYGLEMTHDNYATQSSKTTSLTEDLKDAALQAAIQQLSGAEASYLALEQAQTNFSESFINYQEDKADEKNYANATLLKKEVIKIINGQLTEHLELLGKIDETAISSFAQTVEQLIATNNEQVGKRTDKVEEMA
ncbi:hypothetical protein KDU71_00805 [Carboxylicivirga sediminis]|uniref:Uncharacterized protein n=1 Tax=Carboxylicivirga sediminis TaxID=2006564 RepID=A0A941F1J5_9BACT|nr:DUF6261 family protein [Carboxylicivirga sediminis]MBR8534085.1 hypothetical protein [Carboxylicivirga sediminis]